MSRVLAAIDDSAASRPVLEAAQALAPALGARVEAIHVSEDGGRTACACAERVGLSLRVVAGDPLEAVATSAGDDDVAVVAVGARARPGHRQAGHFGPALANRIDKPVLVVPPEFHAPDRVRRALLAMEGTLSKAKTAKRVIELAADAGLELTVVHVDDEASIPSFSDQVQHETDAYAREFLARYAPGAPRARLEFRIGAPADEILASAEATRAELLAVGWPQSEDPERGPVAREVLGRSRVPVLLVAVA